MRRFQLLALFAAMTGLGMAAVEEAQARTAEAGRRWDVFLDREGHDG